MSARTSQDDKPLNIPSFLLNPTRIVQTQPPEDEVDAVMESVRQAAALPPEPAPMSESTSAQGPEPAHSPETDSESVADAEPSARSEAPQEAEPAPEPTDQDAGKESGDADAPAEPVSGEPGPEPEPAEPPAADPEPAEPEPTLEEDLAALDAVERHLYAHRYASAELETFGETIDPAKASADRAEALSILMEEDHERLSDPAVGSMLERLSSKSDELEPIVAAQVRVLTRDRNRLVCVPATEQAKLVRLQAEAYDVWLKSKAEDDWRSFAPYLDRLVNLQRKIAKAKNPDADPYDTLLDEHEPGTNRAFYNSFFARVKRCVIPLLSAISMSGRTLSRSCIEGRFDEGRQWELARDVARLEGIDESAHYLTATEHPFSQAMTSNYAVTAAHVVSDDLMSNVYTMLHEVGHNLYEQGVDPALNRTSLKGGTSMGMHESQSRFFENYIGRDRAFMRPLLSLLKQRFPGQLSRVTPNQLFLAVNRVAPSFIRTDADELTYPLHIIVRYEIEQLLLAGEATAREVPKLWAERYQKYIGANVTSDSLGALQDVHWAQGAFGYFPTYALGNAYAAQFRAKMIDEGMDWKGLLAAGNLAPIREWLHDRVWRHGRSKDPAAIIEQATGEPFNPRHYANYLTSKYTTIYGIK